MFNNKEWTFWAKQSLQPVLVKTQAIYPAMLFFPCVTRVSTASQVCCQCSAKSVAFAAVERGWVCSLTDIINPLNYMSSFLTDKNIFASINIGYIDQIYYFQLSIYAI